MPKQTKIHDQKGLSLVELMVALTISIFLMGGVVQIFLSSKKTYNVNEGLSRLQENVRFAFDRISTDMSAGGYMGCNDSRATDPAGNLLITNALNDNAAIAYDFTNPLTGVDGNGPNGSDTLSVRRALTAGAIPLDAPMDSTIAPVVLDDTHPNYATLQQWEIIAVTDCNTASIFMITNDPQGSAGIIQHAPGVVAPAGAPNEGQSNLLTIVDGVNSNDLKWEYGSENASSATAYRVNTNTYNIQANAAGGFSLFSNNTEIVEGVEDMQVLYGLDTDGDLTVERYVPAGPLLDAAGMNRVASVKIDLVLNAGETVLADGSTRSKSAHGQVIRKNMSQTIRLRNR